MSNNRLQELNDEVMESIGYRPLSNRIKPVHIANGLFREVLQESYSLNDINIWAKRFKKGREIYSGSYIKEKYSEVLDDDMSLDEINELRGFIEMLLDADRAVTPDLRFTTLTIPSKNLVGGEVQNEFKIPHFIFKILNTEINGKVSPAIAAIKNLLQDETDEISKFISPLITSTNSEKRIYETFKGDLSGIELQIRTGFDLLVVNSKLNTNKLAFLQRIITFSCFATLYHLSSKILDLTIGKQNITKIPIVFDSNLGDETIKIASQESLLLARLNIESYYEKVLEEVLQNNYELNSKEDVLKHILEFSFPKKTNSNNEISPHEEMKNLFLGYFNQTDNLIQSYARSIRIIMFSKVINSSDPSESYAALGSKIGLVFGRNKKRFMPTPEILEIILLSILDPHESLTLSEFGQRLWQSYGIIIGANPDEDFFYLKRWGISEHIPGDLHLSLANNAEYISESFISMGYAKRYADGVIIFSL